MTHLSCLGLTDSCGRCLLNASVVFISSILVLAASRYIYEDSIMCNRLSCVLGGVPSIPSKYSTLMVLSGLSQCFITSRHDVLYLFQFRPPTTDLDPIYEYRIPNRTLYTNPYNDSASSSLIKSENSCICYLISKVEMI